jgi:hypothetical protein
MGTVILRRAMFVVALLTTHPLCFLIAGLVQRNLSLQSHSIVGAVLATVIYGGSWTPYFLLAIWVSGRKDWWRTLGGWGRLAIYSAATIYGAALTVPVQYSFVDAGVDGGFIKFSPDAFPFNWPGLELEDYSFSALCVLGILFQAWILLPVMRLSRFALVEKGQSFRASATVSIALMMWWTVLAGLIIAIIQFLAFGQGELTTSFQGQSVYVAVKLFAMYYAPWLAISALVTLFVAWGWTGNRWMPLAVLVGAIALNGLSQEGVAVARRWCGYYIVTNSNIGEVTMSDRWSYVAGEVAMVWIALGMSRGLGIQLNRGEVAEPKPKGIGTTAVASTA